MTTKQFRQFRGMNLTDARPAIEDDEWAWLENAMTIGNGAVQLVPAEGASIATIAAGITSIWGFTLTLSGTPTPVIITVNDDGSMDQIEMDGTTTNIGGAGTVSTSAHLSIWRDTPILIIDPTAGYLTWDGATLTVVDAAKTGVSIVSFEGRVWIARSNSRTIEFTAPNTNNDFTAGNGAGSTIITDEAFTGVLRSITSALEQLWVIGDSAIEAIANVQSTGTAPNVVTTFSVTNIVTGLGTNADASHAGYFRALTFMAPVGAFALSGVTPQKLSDKLDGMFPALTLGNAPVAIATVQNLLVLCFLVTYTQSLAPSLPTPASGATTATPIVLCFAQGKWFVATQGALVWLTTLIRDGVTEAWGTDGSDIFQLFGAASTTAVAYKVLSKLYDFGLATDRKQNLKFGFEYQAEQAIDPTVTIDNESTSQEAGISLGNELELVNNDGDTLTILNNSNDPLTILAQGMVLSRTVSEMYGRYLGWSVTGEDPPYRMQAFQMLLAPAGEWDTP